MSRVDELGAGNKGFADPRKALVPGNLERFCIGIPQEQHPEARAGLLQFGPHQSQRVDPIDCPALIAPDDPGIGAVEQAEFRIRNLIARRDEKKAKHSLEYE